MKTQRYYSRTIRSRRFGRPAFLLLIALIAAIFMVPHLMSYSPLSVDLGNMLRPPSTGHWLGTDQLGRDGLSRLLWGGQFSLLMALTATSAAAVIGVVMGTLAGGSSRRLDI